MLQIIEQVLLSCESVWNPRAFAYLHELVNYFLPCPNCQSGELYAQWPEISLSDKTSLIASEGETEVSHQCSVVKIGIKTSDIFGGSAAVCKRS